MDLNGLMNKLIKIFIKTAVYTGIDVVARRGKPEAEMTPEELAEAKRARELADRAQEIAKVTGRFGR